MKLIAVSFNESGHYELHNLLFEKAQNDFSKETIVKRGVYPQEVKDLNYYPQILKDISILIKKDSEINIKFLLLKKPKIYCGFLEVYEDDKLIFKDVLYPYYPKS